MMTGGWERETERIEAHAAFAGTKRAFCDRLPGEEWK